MNSNKTSTISSLTFVIGTSGHIDHGKTSLIKALTGVDTDRWTEEKKRGITIDLGFAHYEDQQGNQMAFVDVPGHEKYIHNMLAGLAGLDAVLLVVAADEGVMPQTREHLNICNLLKIKTKKQLPEISRFDPQALALCLRPGNIAKFTRKSITALETEYYRVCV